MLDYNELFKFEEQADIYLKAVYGNDSLYFSEDGKPIIFRNVRGKIIPIETDSADYADWLISQGVEINPSNQQNLKQIEGYLDALTRVRELGGPEAQAKYEQQLLDYLKQYSGAAQSMGYDQALSNKAQQEGVSTDELKSRYKDMYEKNKGNTIKAATDKDKEWEYFISNYTDDMLSRSPNQAISSTEWGLVKAFDLALMISMDAAKKGTPPSQVDLLEILDSEIKTRDHASRLFGARYDPKTTDEEHNLAVISLLDGIENLSDHVKRDTDFGKNIEAAFTKIYAKMFHDFDKPNRRNLSPMSGNIVPDHDFEVPDELPDTFTNDEAASLMKILHTHAGNKLPASHKILLHTMARMFEQIPSSSTTRLAVEFHNNEKGLNQVHKTAFIRGFMDYREGLTGEIDPEELVEEALRKAIKLKDSKNPLEIASGIKKLVSILGALDGAYAAKNNKSVGIKNQDEIRKLWHNSPVQGGRQKGRGDGPNIVSLFTDPDIRKNAQYDNQTLKIIHSGRKVTPDARTAITQASSNIEEAPTPATPQTIPTQPGSGSASTPDIRSRYTRSGSSFHDKGGDHTITVVPSGTDPVSGMKFARIKVEMTDGRVFEPDTKIYVNSGTPDPQEFFNRALDEGRKVALQASQDRLSAQPTSPIQPEPEAPKTTPEPAPRSTKGQTSPSMTDEDKALINNLPLKLAPFGVKITETMAGMAWSLKDSQGNHLGTLGHNHGLKLIRKDTKGQTVKENVDSVDQVMKLLNLGQQPVDSKTSERKEAAPYLGLLKDIAPDIDEAIADTLSKMKAAGFKAQRNNSTNAIRIYSKDDNKEVTITGQADGSVELQAGNTKLTIVHGEAEEILAQTEKYLNSSDEGVVESSPTPEEIEKQVITQSKEAGAVSQDVIESLESNKDELLELYDTDYPAYVRKLKDTASRHNTSFKELHEKMKELTDGAIE